MSKNKPVFFDNTGKRQKIVDFVLLILIFVVAIGGGLTAYYLRRITKIESSVSHIHEAPSKKSTTILYTETNSASYTVIGDQIQNFGNLLIPKYLVTNLGITTPLSYEKLHKSVRQQSNNINTAYTTYYLLSSQNFNQQPVERNFSPTIDANLPTTLSSDQINEISTNISSDEASGLYINLDLNLIKTPEQVKQYTDWLNLIKQKLNSHELHLGILVDPASVNEANKSVLKIAEQIYFGQSKSPIENQFKGLKLGLETTSSETIVELPTTSTKTNTKETSRSTVNIDYRSVDDLLLDKIFSRNSSGITVKDGSYIYNISDAITDYNYTKSLNEIRNNKPIEYAISDPGFEEYTLWKILAQSFENITTPDILSGETASGLVINEEGSGQVYGLKQKATPGERKLTFDSTHKILTSKLTKIDTANQVVRQGENINKVALTFDDGPNPVYTPKIMDILESYGVRGTFFATGQNVLAYPETARAIIKRGHRLENHTFNHPVFSMLTEESKRSQIESTNNIIQEVTGTRPQYFRMPYSDRNEATSTSDVAYLSLLKDLGLQASEYEIDSKDWQLSSSEEIIERVKQQFEASNGHFSEVLLHDTHENTELTLQALPKIIEYIKSQGLEIVTVDKLVNEPVVLSSSATTKSYHALQVQRGVVKVFTGFSIIFIVLSLIRYVWMFVGSIFYKFKRNLLGFLSNNIYLRPGSLPKLAVIIACYNEAKVIGKTIEALQKGTHQDFRLILVNDGSTDKTAEIIERYALEDRRIKLINIPNGGKANALEQGLSATKSQWLVFCDADTIFSPNALYEFALSATFDNRLDAIAGKIIVGNDNNLLTKSQLIEYEIAYKFVKSSQDISNMITVVPGAAGLWKRKSLIKAGGFNSDTLAEDADTTMRVISHGGRVGYRANIVAYTEAPEKLKMLFKQRTRWQLGNMQSIYKHRKGLFNLKYGTLGVVGLPMFFIDLLAAVTYPFIFVVTVIMLFSQGSVSIDRLKSIATNPSTDLAVYLGIILIVIEVILVLFVVLTVKNSLFKKVTLILAVPYYVTVYKLFLSLFTLVALLRALKGKMQGWGYQSRTSSVSISN